MSAGFPQFSPSSPQQQSPPSDPQQPQGGAPEGQAPQQGQRLQSPAPPIMQLLGGWHRVSGEIGEVHPQILAMMQKISAATREALTILARAQHGRGLDDAQH